MSKTLNVYKVVCVVGIDGIPFLESMFFHDHGWTMRYEKDEWTVAPEESLILCFKHKGDALDYGKRITGSFQVWKCEAEQIYRIDCLSSICGAVYRRFWEWFWHPDDWPRPVTMNAPYGTVGVKKILLKERIA